MMKEQSIIFFGMIRITIRISLRIRVQYTINAAVEVCGLTDCLVSIQYFCCEKTFKKRLKYVFPAETIVNIVVFSNKART